MISCAYGIFHARMACFCYTHMHLACVLCTHASKTCGTKVFFLVFFLWVKPAKYIELVLMTMDFDSCTTCGV